MANKTVAIDIGSSMIRLAEVETRGGDGDPRDGAVLQTYGQREVPPGVFRKGELVEPGLLSEIIRNVVSDAKPSSKKVVVGIKHSSIVTREMTLPSQPIEKLRSSLAFQVQDELPISVDEAILDFYPTAEGSTDQGDMLRGVLVAVNKDLVTGILELLKEAELEAEAIDLSAFGLYRGVVRGENSQRTVAVLDIGAASATLVISQQGAIRQIRQLGYGGDNALQAVKDSITQSGVDHEAIKREIGMDPTLSGERGQISSSVAHAMTPLLEAIHHNLAYFQSSNGGVGVDRIILTGGSSYLRGLGQGIATQTRLPVVIGDATQGIGFGKRATDVPFRGQEAAVATVLGLAMGGAA